MAGQTDSADDLIAELAKLMAADAQSDKPKREPPATVRIPGGEAAVRVDETAEQVPLARPVRIPGDEPSPRIPSETAAPRPDPIPTPAPEPFVFDFDRPAPIKVEDRSVQVASVTPQRVEPSLFTPVSSATPVKPEPRDFTPAPKPRVEPIQAAPVAPPAPVAIAPQDEPAPAKAEEPLPDLDGDSLADLIAAELAIATETIVPNETPDDGPVDAIDVTAEAAGTDLPRQADVFGVPPVFGLGSGKPLPEQAPERIEPSPEPRVAPVVAPAPVQAARAAPTTDESDPLAEIERLIGPAAHVQPPAAPSPALRSLATPTVPQKEPPVASIPAQPRVQVNSVEEAILSAAATSGAQVEWVEPIIAANLRDDETSASPRAQRRPVMGMTRAVAGPLVATLLLAVAAVGLYTVLGLGGPSNDGPAPLLAADTTAVKEIPEPAPDASETTQSVVFNEIAGVDQAADEQIVSRDQADVEAVTQVAAADVNQEGLVNRKVRTVTVRPDGTIVSGNDSLAGSAMLPVDRPQVPDVPGADFSVPDLIANAAPENSLTTPEPTAATLPPVQPGSSVPAVDLTGATISGLMAPVPLSRPSTFTPQASAAATPVETTPITAAPVTSTATPATTPTQTLAPTEVAVAPAAQPTTAPAATTSSAPAYVQLSSQRSEEAARQTAQEIASRYGSLFNGANLEVQRVDLGERGIFYRVRVPADSLQSANALCSSVKANGGDCFTL